MRSLLGPLVLGLVLSLAAVFAVQWSLVRAASETVMREYIAGELAQDADELFSALAVNPGGDASIALSHFDPAFLTPASGRYYQVTVDGAVALRSLSLTPHTLPATSVAQGARSLSDAPGPDGQLLLMSASGYAFQGRPVTIAVAADLRPTQAELARFLSGYTQLSAALFAMLVVLQVVIVRMALSPLKEVQADVGRLERGEIRQLGEAVPAEILPLVREVNRLLELLAQRLQRSRDALGNLAHALKAPLTMLTQIANDERLGSQPALGPQMREQLAILGNRIDSELRRARVAGGRIPAAPLDLASEMAALVGVVSKLYRQRELAIDCDVEPGSAFHGDREDLLELCGNLLDNACKWARSRVRIAVHDGDGVTVTVEDDGPGCTPEEAQQLMRRGVRLDEATEGHGLGLSIVKSIATAYGASVAIDRSAALGGFRATVVFPQG